MAKAQEITNKTQLWTMQELEVLQEIHAGLKLNGWQLNHIERRGRGWHFFIVPLEECEEPIIL